MSAIEQNYLTEYQKLIELQKQQLEMIDLQAERQTQRVLNLLERAVDLQERYRKGSPTPSLEELIQSMTPGSVQYEPAPDVAQGGDTDPLEFASSDPSLHLET